MRNKNLIALILSLALVLPYAGLAHGTEEDHDAEDNSTEVSSSVEDENKDAASDDSTNRRTPLQNARDVLKDKADQLQNVRTNQAERKEERAERRGSHRDAQLARLKNSMAVHINRMQHAINKLQNIIDRIDGAVSKLNEQGVDTSSVDSLVTQAKDEKAEAIRLLDDAKAKHAAILESEHPREAVTEFISSLRALKSQLVKLHGTLVETVRTLKSLIKENQ